MTTNIEDFYDRPNLDEIVIGLLEKKILPEVILRNKLLEFPGFKFKHGYNKFLGKTLSQIADEIDKNTPHGRKMFLEIIERGIHHMIDLNTDE